MKRRDFKEVRKIFVNAGLTLLDDVYKSVDAPMKCVDENGYLFSRSLRTVEDNCGKSKKYQHYFSLKNKYYWENMLHYIETNVTTGTKLISHKEDYHSEKDLLEFVCGSCGSHFKKRWHDFVGNENKVCAECFRKIQQNYDYVEERRNSLEEYQKIASQSGLKILSESIDNLHSKVIVEDKEGYKGQMWAVTLLRGSSFEKFSCRNPYSIWNINHYIELKELKNKVPEQSYTGTKQLIKIQCECGNYFETTVGHFMNGVTRCKECRKDDSFISSRVKEWLKENNIDFVQEKSFDDCRNKQVLRFDYFIPRFNCVIEVDGIQHYKPIRFDGGAKEDAQKRLEKTQENDKIKDDYCKLNSVPLLRIPFWKIEKSDEYQTILKDFFLSLQK